MTNRFGVALHSEEVRWAAAEDVTETVIAAVWLLHERSVEEIAGKLTPVESRGRHQARWAPSKLLPAWDARHPKAPPSKARASAAEL